MKRIVNIVSNLALSDLKHEWILSLCLIIALASVIAPLMILMGLKNGTIKTLRHRLVEDPAFKEIRPVDTREYQKEWFKKLAKDERIAFVIPTILPAASTIYAQDGNNGKFQVIDLVPTGPGDPLMENANIAIPEEGGCVLSFGAAQELHIQKGESLKVKVSRYRKGRYEYAAQQLKVIGVLPKQAGMLPVIYAPLQFVLDVEAYKEGKAVLSRGWKGNFSRPYMRFDALLIIADHHLDPLLQNGLLIESGLAKIEERKCQQIEWMPGWTPSPKNVCYTLSIPDSVVGLSAYYSVKNRLRGQNAFLVPYNYPLKLSINNKPVKVIGLSLSEESSKHFGGIHLPWGKLKKHRKPQELKQIIIPHSFILEPYDGAALNAAFVGVDQITFPLNIVGRIKSDYGIIPLELSGILRTAALRNVEFDKKSGEFVLGQMGFRGFRLYARSIDDVEAVYNMLKSQNIPVVARIEEIQHIKTLDRGLSRLLALVGILGISGAIAVLIASLYAAVERKRSHLAIMRLIGLSRMEIFFFPVFQGLFIATGASVVALAAYKAISELINFVFKSEMRGGEAICTLPLSVILWTLLATLAIAVISSFVGARKTTNIDPAEAIRAE